LKADPVILHYTLDPTAPPPEKPLAYDIEIKVDDVATKSRMNHAAVNMTSESVKELAKIDDEVCSLYAPNPGTSANFTVW
jgi:SWI/SNF-related matrix-associated actin-dependent regulator of chromatin subfamily D